MQLVSQLKALKNDTHSPATRSPISAISPAKPPISANLFAAKNPVTLARPCGSGSTKVNLRPGGSVSLDGGFCGS
jgi:hypothetical protein